MSWNIEQAANDLERYVLRKEPPAVDACKVLIDHARAVRTCKRKRDNYSINPYCSECDAYMDNEDNYCPNCGAKVVE